METMEITVEEIVNQVTQDIKNSEGFRIMGLTEAPRSYTFNKLPAEIFYGTYYSEAYDTYFREEFQTKLPGGSLLTFTVKSEPYWEEDSFGDRDVMIDIEDCVIQNLCLYPEPKEDDTPLPLSREQRENLQREIMQKIIY